ncbi:DNA mismatch repair protein MSH6 [Camellia lanceoleosa]|uniref:DNA mismatch repair protein MSH6 n=1 Tax=Camellia lanceoleosa TaxID=1840588 RepID=A0ACC0IU81_9ERIC|nr:DNA mismatch repair protein MSH6 [Camellia lanceoleosa]
MHQSSLYADLLWRCNRDRRDANRRHGDVNYDPTTLYLPPILLRAYLVARQWWEFKSKHMDKVLFFKMGKFYELFEMDAHVGAKELDLQYMKGYWVLVVEQTETPEQLELRRKEKSSKDKMTKKEFSILVDRSVGGSEIVDGQLELMLHRRLVHDDSRGVAEALNETVCIHDECTGLTGVVSLSIL